MSEQQLYQSHPSMFRNHPIGFIVSVILIAGAGVGLIILIIWWLKTQGTTLTVTDERITLRRGILSKDTSEVYHGDIRNVKVSQGVLQRMLSVGSIAVSTSGTGEVEIAVHGIPHPHKIKTLIDQHRRRA